MNCVVTMVVEGHALTIDREELPRLNSSAPAS